MTNDPLSFLQAVSGFNAGQKTDNGFRLAVIDPTYDPSAFPGTLPRVTFEHEAAVSTKRYAVLSPYWPRQGDRVLMVPIGDTYIISGATGNATPGRMVRVFKRIGATAPINCNGAIADVPGTEFQVNVMRPGAEWAMVVFADFRSVGTTATTGIIRANVDGVDAGPEAHFNQSNVAAGLRGSTGQVVDGTFATKGLKTFKLRAWRSGGGDGQVLVEATHTGYLLIVIE